MDVRSLKKDVQRGAATIEDVLDAVLRLDRRVRHLVSENDRLRRRLAQYEPEAAQESSPEADAGKADHKASRYSLEDEERRRGKRPVEQGVRTGRMPTSEKWPQAARYEDLYPTGAPVPACELAAQRVVWRIEQGQAVLVGYRLHRGPDGTLADVPDVLPRGEFDLQIVLTVAFLTYVVHVSLDQVCALVRYFWGLPLAKSQADALLNQLARRWQPEFDRLCELLALSLVVYTDETSWSLAHQSSTAWVFSTPRHTVLTFGCDKSRATRDRVLPPDVFRGVLVSDDHALYHDRERAQKCWAHLLRKAIRLVLLYPENTTYGAFLDELLALYREAQRRRQDARLGADGRSRLAEEFNVRVRNLCHPHCWGSRRTPRTPHARDFRNLANELYRLAEADELFTFVRDLAVEPTNNVSERKLRGPAQDRKAGRTSRSHRGARRRSIISSVLESLRQNLPDFRLSAMLSEVLRWLRTGRSLFARQLQALRRQRVRAAFDTG